MLIVERRPGEIIQIGEEIRLRVIDTDGETVRLGIEAPRDVAVRAPAGETGAKMPETPASARAVDEKDGGSNRG